MLKYQRCIENKGFHVNANIPLPGLGDVKIFKPVEPDAIEELKKSEFYRCAREVNSKLEPIVTLIKESEVEMYDHLDQMFKGVEALA